MTDILRRIQRLRELEETRSRVALVEAQQDEEAARAQVEAEACAIDASRTLVDGCRAGDLAHHHAFAGAAEEARRDALGGLHRCAGEVAVRQVALRDKAIEAEVMRGMADAREAERRAVNRRREQAELDEAGTQRWVRRTR